jgi:hypothetical protein
MFHQGAKVKRDLPPTTPRIQAARDALDSTEFSRKNEAHRMALANRNKPWARRWLRANGHMY